MYLLTRQSANESKLHENKKMLTNDDLVLLEQFQISQCTGLSDLKTPSTCAYNVFTHFGHNHILGINTSCPKGVPLPRIYRMYFFIVFTIVARYVSRIRYVFDPIRRISDFAPYWGSDTARIISCQYTYRFEHEIHVSCQTCVHGGHIPLNIAIHE